MPLSNSPENVPEIDADQIISDTRIKASEWFSRQYQISSIVEDRLTGTLQDNPFSLRKVLFSNTLANSLIQHGFLDVKDRQRFIFEFNKRISEMNPQTAPNLHAYLEGAIDSSLRSLS